MKATKAITASLLSATLLWAASVQADLKERLENSEAEYAATRLMTAEGNILSSRYYHRPDRNRSETSMEGVTATMILRMDRQVAWTLMPGNMYMEVDLSEADTQPSPEQSDLLDSELVGKEVVNGFPSEKWRVRTRDDEGNEAVGHLWITEGKDPIVVKMDMDMQPKGSKKPMRFAMELQDLQIAAQPPALFELPAGAKPMSLGGILSGALGGGVGNADPDAAPGSSGPNIADEVADSAAKGAKDAATGEVYRGVRDSVGGGIRKLFGK